MALPVPQAVGAKAEGTTSCQPGWPAHQALDIALLGVEVRFLDDIPVPGDGWVQVQNSPQVFSSGGTSSTTLAVFWKRAAGAAEGAPTLNSANHIVAQILTFRGCIATGDPWEAGAGDGDVLTSASTAVAVPGGETTTDDCLIVSFCAIGPDTADPQFTSWANTDLANVAEIADSFTALGNGGGFGVATGELATAGEFGTTTATAAAPFAQARLSLALKPAAGGGEEHSGSSSASGGGSATSAGSKGGSGQTAASGAGAARSIGGKGGLGLSSATGAGAAVSIGQKHASGTSLGSGGGTATSTGSSVEAHSGSSSATGGGRATSSGRKGGVGTSEARGRGEGTTGSLKQAISTSTASGAGAVVTVGQSARFGMSVASGGGFASSTGFAGQATTFLEGGLSVEGNEAARAAVGVEGAGASDGAEGAGAASGIEG